MTAKNKKYDIYGIGNALLDIEYKVEQSFFKEQGIEKGYMTLVEESREIALSKILSPFEVKRSCGGSAANTIIGASLFGAKTYYTCKVAKDQQGADFTKDLVKHGVSSNIFKQEYDGKTGICLVLVTDDGERTMNTFLGITQSLSIEQVNIDEMLQARFAYAEGYLCTSDSARLAVKDSFRVARQNNLEIAMTLSDPSMAKYFRPQILEMMSVDQGLDILFCNEEEAQIFTESKNLENSVFMLKDYAKSFCITRGAKGALIYDGVSKKVIEIAAYPTKLLDSNGAGDMFAGAFLYGITHGLSFSSAGELANLSASKVVSQYGPRLTQEVTNSILQQFNKG